MELPITPEEIVEQKLKPQIEAQGLTKEEAKQYVKDYIAQAGEQFLQAIEAQIEQIKASFQAIVQKIITLTASLLSLPAILANPLTLAVANQTLQEILGNIKGVNQEISNLSSQVQQMIGSVPGVFDSLKEAASSVESDAKSSMVLASVKVGDQEEKSMTDPKEVISYIVPNIEGISTIVWTGVDPATRIEIGADELVPSGISVSTSGLTVTITISNLLVNNNTSWSYNIGVTYLEEDGMDDLGNTIYKNSYQTYSGIIIK